MKDKKNPMPMPGKAGMAKKPMPGLENRPGKKMAPKNSKMEALKSYMSGMKKGKK